MAVLIDIRNRFGPVIVILIALALGLFVLETALNSNSSLLSGNKDVVGIVDGEKIRYNDYITKVDEALTTQKLNAPNQPINDITTYQLRDQAWNQMISDKINTDLFEKLGITVSDAEKKDMFFGTDPNPEIKKTFTNPQTGIFDPTQVANYIKNLDKSVNGEDVTEKQVRWLNFEKFVNQDRLQTKFSSGLKSAMYVPKWLAQEQYNEKNTKYSFDFVAIPFSSIPDSTVKVSDDEIRNYINENKEKFKQEDSRKVEFVMFTVLPTSEDTAAALKTVADATLKLNEASIDTNYIKLNADRGLDKYYFSKGIIPQKLIADTLMSVVVGGVLGPIYKDGMFYTAKVVDRKILPDSVKTSIIAFSNQAGADTVKIVAKVDSVFNAIKGGASFEQLAAKYSEDKTSGQKGGDIGYVKQGMNIPQMNEYLFFGGAQQGEMKVIKTDQAYFIVKVAEVAQLSPSIQYYIFSRKVEASSKSDKAVFEKANSFASKNSTDALFTQAFKTDNTINKQTADQVLKNSYQLQGLQNARELVTWAYKNEKGAVSPVITSENNYVIGHLIEIKNAGTPTVEDARAQVEPLVRNKKKGEKIASDLAAALALNSTIESIAAKYSQEVKNAPDVNFNQPYINNIGVDNYLIGSISTMKGGEISKKPIVGNANVFVVKLNNVVEPTPVADYSAIKDEIIRTASQRVQYGITEALKKKLKIDDLRYNFF